MTIIDEFNTTSLEPSRVGPRVSVEVKYYCNGCQFHTVMQDDIVTTESFKRKSHACRHPAVIERHGCAQWFGLVSEDISIHHMVQTEKYLCPYLDHTAN